MQEFDANLWRDRAWERMKRAHISGESKKKTEIQWAIDIMSIADLDKLVKWCTGRGVQVLFVKKVGATYYPDRKLVKIAHRLKPIRQLAFLLHECGHHLIGTKEQSDRFGMGYPQVDPVVKRSFHHRLACLEEEMEAWHRGWKLAMRLGLSIRREVFDDIRLECVRTYVKWSLRPGPMSKDNE